MGSRRTCAETSGSRSSEWTRGSRAPLVALEIEELRLTRRRPPRTLPPVSPSCTARAGPDGPRGGSQERGPRWTLGRQGANEEEAMNCTCGEPLNQSVIQVFSGNRFKSCPNCSMLNGKKHQFFLETDFGTRVMQPGHVRVQSWCTECRNGQSPRAA